MKILQDAYNFQELAQFSVQIIGRLVMVGVIVVLVSLWVLTEPFYELSKWIKHGGNIGSKNN
jgi:hypothetical protein